jgi:hypothetical protein
VIRRWGEIDPEEENNFWKRYSRKKIVTSDTKYGHGHVV